ncbi:Acyl-coenzyme A thioesterase 13 [Plecturocebus cupreus]
MVQQEELTILNIYAPNTGAPRYGVFPSWERLYSSARFQTEARLQKVYTMSKGFSCLASASQAVEITGVHHDVQTIFVFLVETGFHHVGQAALKLLTSSDLPALASQSAEITQTKLYKRMKHTLLKVGYLYSNKPVTLVSAAPGKVICEMKVEEEHTNKLGTLHGGLTATLIDNISTFALLCTERGAPGVSVDMNITYMSPAKLGEDVVITAHVLKQGKTLAFASVDLTNKATGKLIAQGRHTKHLGN